MLTTDDAKIIRSLIKEEVTDAINKAVAPLATKKELKKELKETELRLKKEIKREHKYQGEILNYCEKEDRKIGERVEKIERHLNFTTAI